MIFVTGGSGLIGSFLISALVARGQAVRALYRRQVPTFPAASQVEWVEGDILDALVIRQALEGVEHVFHCAGLVSYAPQDEAALQQINVEGTANIVDACLDRKGIRLCHVSSVAALGGNAAAEQEPGKMQVLTEEAKWDLGAAHPAYATSKYLGELEVWRGVAEGLSAVIVNPSVVLGAADWDRSSTRLFRYAHNEHAFYTPGNINFVDVRDVVEAMVHLAFQPAIAGQRFILNAGAVPLHDFLAQAAACFGKKAPRIAVPDWAAELIWRTEHARSLLTGARPLITKDTARAGRKPVVYQSQKVQNTTGLRFRPLAETIEWCCQELKTNSAASGAVVVY
ncbi:NAD-dependent epimerase/dehydratase family protein [Hymenobacter metallicola]|uniref:NAD-dependent epimerase/dehydratase family protein n=1 Tax=Hymenobacter metallicola TaxID=2563114 RepID=A0A4Z0QAW0_9BACT|nr:NAD-dependent epimerase/dehydratase family protein [Hymenobacter metallicola]TGE27217.1 NAD-dependent epimerase/dehydratase family protein [Hymenobacter metallicola]